MKLASVTNLDRRNTATLKKFDSEVVSESYDVMTILPIYDWLGAIRNLVSGHMVYDS